LYNQVYFSAAYGTWFFAVEKQLCTRHTTANMGGSAMYERRIRRTIQTNRAHVVLIRDTCGIGMCTGVGVGMGIGVGVGVGIGVGVCVCVGIGVGVVSHARFT